MLTLRLTAEAHFSKLGYLTAWYSPQVSAKAVSSSQHDFPSTLISVAPIARTLLQWNLDGPSEDSSLRGLWHTKVWLAAMYSPKQELLSTSAWQFDFLLSMKSRCLSLHYCLHRSPRHQWSSIPIARMPQRLQRPRTQKRPSYNLFFESKEISK